MCQTKQDGYLRWMKCPLESYGSADSKREFLDDMNTSEHEQKFCYGDLEHCFCCSIAKKMRVVRDYYSPTLIRPDIKMEQSVVVSAMNISIFAII